MSRKKSNPSKNKKNKKTRREKIFLSDELINQNKLPTESNFLETPKEEFKKEDEQEKIKQSESAPLPEEFDQEDVAQNKYVAAFSYLSFLFFVPLLLKRKSLFCQKHAKQGLVWFVFLLVSSFCYFIPWLNILYALIIISITLNSLFQTLKGNYWRIPLIYKLAEKINL